MRERVIERMSDGPVPARGAVGFAVAQWRGIPVSGPRRACRRMLAAWLALAVACSGPAAPVFAVDAVGGTAVPDLQATVAAAVPDVAMASGVLVAPDGRELWSRDPGARRAMASTTKIMTAIVVLENAGLDEVITVSAQAATVGESAADLRAGDTLTVAQALEALLVKSGNDAAVVLAEHVAGSEAAFVELMNAKASEMGLHETHFANPHGLDQTGHYTSARDLAAMARYAMALPEFRRGVGLLSAVLDSPRGPRTLYSSNKLLLTYSGANGVKTGWTDDAGYCLVASAERDGVELIAVVLGASDEQERFRQASKLLDWGFAHYGVRRLAQAEQVVGSVPVSDYLDVEVRVLLPEDLSAQVFDLDGEIVRTVALPEEIDAPVTVDERVGTLTISQGGVLVAQAPVVAASNVTKPGVLEAIWIAIQRVWRGIFGEPAGT